MLDLVKKDTYLSPFSEIIERFHHYAECKKEELTNGKSLSEISNGHHYFGLFKEKGQWIIREWAPNATKIYLIGTFNDWKESEDFQFTLKDNHTWELILSSKQLKHKDLYALSVHWEGGSGKRIPAWSKRVLQDPETLIFNAQVWNPTKSYKWKNNNKSLSKEAPLIYEAHIGMAGEEAKVSSYKEFRENVLPRIKSSGYNTIQFMAIPEHPYYGSFGYHVSSFFAPSSRFGTPEELKELIDEAHGMGLRVIMDLVHSHAVKNELEGLGLYDGTRYQFFHDGAKGEHPAWDSYCFNYGKDEVLHFLLSNIKYWLEEFQFDGYRFDGVTSMLYLDHGLGKAFTSYDDYYSLNTDGEAVTYFILANQLIHEINPNAISVAEEMSGMPGLAAPIEYGGLGFDYRMAMGVPDFWIKMIKEVSDDHWDMGRIFYELTAHRKDEKVISYTESHDQALVGDKTIIFRLIDKEMYFSMRKDQPNMIVDRGIALHKMIRLATLACAGGGYLNFMGNEFGHPEWIDFPREGNDWSYHHARRIWSISEDHELRFHWLNDFDKHMVKLFSDEKLLEKPEVRWITDNIPDKILVFQRGDYIFIFNFNPHESFKDYGIIMPPAKFKIVLNTDASIYGGHNRVDDEMMYYSIPSAGLGSTHYLKLYLPARTAMVLHKEEIKRVK